MKGSFSKLLRKFSLEGTILGLKYFYSYSDCFSRLFWAAFIIFITQFACIIMYNLYNRFESAPTRIMIENPNENLKGLPLPAITLCTPNQLTLSALKHFEKTLVDGNHSIDLEAVIPQLLSLYMLTEMDPGSLAHLHNLIELNRYDFTDILSMLTQSCEDFLKVCFFRHDRVDRCRGIFNPILTARGMCCTFNNQYKFIKRSGRNEYIHNFEPYKAESSGLWNPLSVVLDFNPEDALTRTLIMGGSTRVMFNDWREFPVDKNSALVSYNTETYHSVCATYTYCSDDVKKLSPESRNCLFSDESRPQYFHGYHNSDCDMMCQVRTIEQQCNCVLPFVPHVRKQVACNLTSLPCVAETRLQMQHLLQKKDCDCPRDCDFREYTVDITAGNLDGISYSLTTEFLYHMNVNKSTSLMNFIFLTPSYVKQRQETVMSITTLFSNIGGVFGLCLGCSLVTVVEIFFYLYVCLRNCFIKNIRRVKKPYREHYYSFHM